MTFRKSNQKPRTKNFNIRQGQWTYFWKRSIQRVSHQSLVQFDLVVLENIKIWKYDRWQTQSDGKRMLLFQKYVHWPCLILKMAAMSSDWLKKLEIFENLLQNYGMFGPIWPCGSWEYQNLKIWQMTDTKWWEKLVWAIGPGELKTFWELSNGHSFHVWAQLVLWF
jgi:hypothetical protein